MCLLNVVFLSPLSPTPPARFLPPPPPPSPLFLPNRSLFMIAWITEEEIRSPLKERCHTELRHTSREEEELRGAWGSLCPRGWCSLAPLRICLCCVPNSSAEVCERPLGSLSLTPVSSSPSSVPGCLAWRGLLTSVESRGRHAVCFNPFEGGGRSSSPNSRSDNVKRGKRSEKRPCSQS